MEFDVSKDILPNLDWKEVNFEQREDQKVDIYYFSLTTCVYCKKGIQMLKDEKVSFKWMYLDELAQEKKQTIKKWIEKHYNLRSRMASPFVIFRMPDQDFISNGYDPDYWKMKIR